MFPCDFAWGAGTAAYQIEGMLQPRDLWIICYMAEVDTISVTPVQSNANVINSPTTKIFTSFVEQGTLWGFFSKQTLSRNCSIINDD